MAVSASTFWAATSKRSPISSPAGWSRRAATGSRRAAFAAGATGAPVLAEALVSFDCALVSAERIGTHHVCIGAVRGVEVAPEGTPLLYGMRRYLRAEGH